MRQSTFAMNTKLHDEIVKVQKSKETAVCDLLGYSSYFSHTIEFSQ